YDDEPTASRQPAYMTSAGDTDLPTEVDRRPPLPAAETAPPPPETVRQPAEEPTALPAATSVQHREVNGAATVEATPTPVEPPPAAEPAAPPGPPRRGWWK